MNQTFKIIFLTILAFTLSGCGPDFEDKTDAFIIPKGWSNCSIAKIKGTDSVSRELTIMRCPHDLSKTKPKTTQEEVKPSNTQAQNTNELETANSQQLEKDGTQ